MVGKCIKKDLKVDKRENKDLENLCMKLKGLWCKWEILK